MHTAAAAQSSSRVLCVMSLAAAEKKSVFTVKDGVVRTFLGL